MKLIRMPAYFYPEVTASSHLEADRLQSFADAGIDVVVYTPTPTRGIDGETRRIFKKIRYEETYNGHVRIYRFSLFREGKNPLLRAFRYILSNLIQYHRSVKTENIDIIYGGSTPPTQGVLCAKVAKKLSKKYKCKVPFIYNLQDIFPDSLVTTGLTRKGSILWKIGRKIENYTYRHADKIIVISESMKKNIMDKGVPEEKITVISNWIDTEATKPVAKADNRLFEEFGLSRDKFTVVYAGNFGKAQGADVILDAAKLLRAREDVQFVIFGGGAGFEDAKKRVADEGLANVIINGLLPQDRVPEVYSLGDVALITCKKGVGNSGMPSKTWSIMACNTPIVAAFDTDSELAEVIAKANAGVTVEPEDADKLATAIGDMADSGAQSFTGGREYVVANASKDVCTAKYVETIKNAIGREEEHAIV